MKKTLIIVIIVIVAYFAFGFGLRAVGTCPKYINQMPTVSDATSLNVSKVSNISSLNGATAGESLMCRAFFFLPTEKVY